MAHKHIKRSIVLLLIIILLISLIPTTAFADEGGNVRVAGKDRYETAFAIADKIYEKYGAFKNVVVASGANYPDALSGAYLAKVKSAPILLVNKSHEAKVKSYIQSKMKKGGTVYLLGGTAVVSSSFEQSLNNGGIKTVRLGGKDRYETNIKILKECGIKNQSILISSGKSFADCLSGSAVGMPILLVGDRLTKDQKNLLQTIGVKKSYILGGTGAVSNTIKSELEKYSTTERIGGANRFETSAKIAKRFFSGKLSTVILAYANNFPDGLAGGPLAIREKAPILLINNNNYSNANSYMKSVGASKTLTLGGTSVLSNKTVSGTRLYKRTITSNQDAVDYMWDFLRIYRPGFAGWDNTTVFCFGLKDGYYSMWVCSNMTTHYSTLSYDRIYPNGNIYTADLYLGIYASDGYTKVF